MDEEELHANLSHLLSPSHPGRRQTMCMKKAITKLIPGNDEQTKQRRRKWLERIEQMRGVGVTAQYNPGQSQKPEQ